jgi:hypothetical protein
MRHLAQFGRQLVCVRLNVFSNSVVGQEFAAVEQCPKNVAQRDVAVASRLRLVGRDHLLKDIA